MSDDTPTERFDAPTAPLPKTAEAADGEAAAPEDRQKRGLLIALLAVAGAILIALIVLIVTLLGSNAANDDLPEPEVTATESPSPTPEETESPEPSEEPSDEPSEEPSATAAPPPPPQSPSFATFSGPNKATCPDSSSSVQLTWSWSSSNATNAWFGIGTQNAKAEPFESVPTTATYSFNYQCSEASQIYTVTLEDSSGRLTHKTVTVTRE
jgi:flagellar basal body-associated protein FliL